MTILFIKMMSSSSLIIFGVIVLISVIVIWKWWKKPKSNNKEVQNDTSIQNDSTIQNTIEPDIPDSNTTTLSDPPPMVFAVNDNGVLDLTDIKGKILNSGYGANPKVYINLLDRAEHDVTRIDSNNHISFHSIVGETCPHEIAGKLYIINYTRLI